MILERPAGFTSKVRRCFGYRVSLAATAPLLVALIGCGGPSSPHAASLGKSTANTSAGAHSALRTPQASRPASEVIGHSVDRRPIVADRLGAAGGCASVFVVGSIAGDEPGGINVVDALMIGTCRGWRRRRRIAAPLQRHRT